MPKIIKCALLFCLLFVASIPTTPPTFAGHCDEADNYENLYRYCEGNEVWEDKADCSHKRVQKCKSDEACVDAECVKQESECRWDFDHNECISCGYARSVELNSCSGDTRISNERVRDRGCDGSDWCGSAPPPPPEPSSTPKPSSTSSPRPSGSKPPPGGPVCSNKLCVYSEGQDQCFIGHCKDGSENCDFNSNCGYIAGCNRAGERTDCYVTEPVIVGAGENVPVACNTDLLYCQGNDLIWQHGGRYRPDDPNADSDGCVYAFDPKGSCGNTSSRPRIVNINVSGSSCKKNSEGNYECPTPSSVVTIEPQVYSPQSDSQCIWQVNFEAAEGPRECSLSRQFSKNDFVRVAPINSSGQGEMATVAFSEAASSASSCPGAGGDFSKTTGTKNYPENGHGHCGLNYPVGYSWCTRPVAPPSTASYALDVRNGTTSMQVTLPAIRGKNVNWQKAEGPFSCGSTAGDMGYGVGYEGQDSAGNVYYLRMCHIDNSFNGNVSGGPSGTVIAGKLASQGMDGDPHLHFTIAQQKTQGGWEMKEPNADFNMCK